MITTLKTKTTQEDVYPNIQTSNIPDSGVTASKIAPSAVTANKIDSGAVTEAKLSSNSVTSAKIASSAVTSTKLATNAVSETKIANGAVTDAKIASVSGTKVRDDSIEVQKLHLRRFSFDKSDTQLTYNQLYARLHDIFKNGQVLEMYREEFEEYPYDTHFELSIGYSNPQGEIYIRFNGTTYTIAQDTDLTNFLNGAGGNFTFRIIYIDGLKDIQ